ncbi:MAG: DUF3224 domain-containing protein [bacterium]
MKILIAALCLTIGSALHAQTSATIHNEASMTARGTFDVKTIPQPADDAAGGPFGRLFLDKKFHGDLDGTSKGQMMAAGTAVEGSGSYVALELVTGTLSGRRGSFMLMHNGSMAKNVPTMLTVTVVPDSGTEQLQRLAGTFRIIIAPDGTHTYEFDYTLGGAHE